MENTQADLEKIDLGTLCWGLTVVPSKKPLPLLAAYARATGMEGGPVISLLQTLTGVSRPTISKVYRGGRASPKTAWTIFQKTGLDPGLIESGARRSLWILKTGPDGRAVVVATHLNTVQFLELAFMLPPAQESSRVNPGSESNKK